MKTCKEIKNCSDVFCLLKPPTPTKPILKINPAVKKINAVSINAVSINAVSINAVKKINAVSTIKLACD